MRSLDEMLALSPWAKDLPPDQLERVRSTTTVKEFEAGAYVCRKSERANAWIGVIDGLVKLTCLARSGKSITLAGITSGSWFGEGSVLKGEPRQYDVVALRGSCIAFMPEATFLWLLDTNLAFNRFLIVQLNERLGQFIGMVEHERLLDPEARVARALAALFNPFLHPGSEPRIQISQEELGYLAGTSRQRVNQALRVLEKAGLVKVDYSLITIVDVEGLRSFGA
jgi:CRP/FNR family transcriptional regulator, cyclic AMP receptor protein